MAAAYLARRGATVLARNLVVGRGEIDVLVRWDDRHAAVEVKTVGASTHGVAPVDRISPAKLAQVRRLATLLEPSLGTVGVDFVGVVVRRDGVVVDWRRNMA